MPDGHLAYLKLRSRLNKKKTQICSQVCLHEKRMIGSNRMSYYVPVYFVILNVLGNMDRYLFKIFTLSGIRKFVTLLAKLYP